ncbi:C39 family peptidase [Mycolicibacterium pulveris]|uniref:C39 family peptidase n=1 Tax=Mycolicibacterium pulveris TaxID=36813 RepID=UPI003CF382CB
MKLCAIGAVTAVALTTAVIGFAGPATATTPTTPGMHGDPEIGARNWSQQTYDDCAIMAAAHLIGYFTGDTPSEEEIVAVAASTPSQVHPGSIYVKPANLDDPNTGGGTDQADIPVLMSVYGLNAVYTNDDLVEETGLDTGMAALEKYLDTSGAVLAMADADIIWKDPGDYGNHAVVVTGLDTANGIVHLNDSGPEDGADEQVSIGDFEKAWAMYGHQLVVAVH